MDSIQEWRSRNFDQQPVERRLPSRLSAVPATSDICGTSRRNGFDWFIDGMISLDCTLLKRACGDGLHVDREWKPGAESTLRSCFRSLNAIDPEYVTSFKEPIAVAREGRPYRPILNPDQTRVCCGHYAGRFGARCLVISRIIELTEMNQRAAAE